MLSTIKTFALLCLFFYSLSLSAQQEFFTSGRIVDAGTHRGLDYCSVRFLDSKGKMITGSISDAKGYFNAALHPGKYTLLIDYLGYQSDTSNIIVQKNNQYLGTYKLKPSGITLHSASVTASAKSYQLDKNVYVVTKKMKAGTSNANDLLDKINGISYDRYNDNIKVDGQTNIKLLVNGIEKDPEYIRALNPDRIKKVELIKDPSGKYGLEGYSAVINLILRQDYTGTELSLFDQPILDPDAFSKDYILPINSANIGLNYTYNRLNVYGRLSHNYNHFSFPINTTKSYSNGFLIERRPPSDPSNNIQVEAQNDGLTLGTDYFINPRHTLSFETRFDNLYSGNKSDHSIYLERSFQNGDLRADHFIKEISNGNHNSNYQSVFYIGHLNDNDQLNASVIRSTYHSQSEELFYRDQLPERRDMVKNAQDRYKIDLEYTHQINPKSSINLGYGFIRLKNDNRLNAESFNYSDQRHKIFGYYAMKPYTKLGIKTGIAGEWSTPEAFGERLQYFIYQPYLDVKYDVSKAVNIKLKYRSESHYPSLNEANPNETYIDAYSVSRGNPNLRPEVIQKLSLRTNVLNGFLSVEPYYHFSDNYIAEVGSLRQDGIIDYSYENVGRYVHYGVKGSIAFPVYKTIYWQTNADVYHSSITYQGHDNALNDFSMSSNLVYVNPASALTTGFIFQRGMNKYITAQGYHKWNNDFLGYLLQKGFLKNRLNLMVLYMLPLKVGVEYIQKEYVETPSYTSLKSYDISLLQNVIVFKVNYRFTRGKSTRKLEKDIQLENNDDSKGIF